MFRKNLGKKRLWESEGLSFKILLTLNLLFQGATVEANCLLNLANILQSQSDLSNVERFETNLRVCDNAIPGQGNLDGQNVTDVSDAFAKAKTLKQKLTLLGNALGLFQSSRKVYRDTEFLVVIRAAGLGIYHWEAVLVEKQGAETEWTKSDSGANNFQKITDLLSDIISLKFLTGGSRYGRVKINKVEDVSRALIMKLQFDDEQMETVLNAFAKSVGYMSVSCAKSACQVMTGFYASPDQSKKACLSCGPNFSKLMRGEFNTNGRPVNVDKIVTTEKKTNWDYVIRSTTAKAIALTGAIGPALLVIDLGFTGIIGASLDLSLGAAIGSGFVATTATQAVIDNMAALKNLLANILWRKQIED